ncbi:E2/UBC family protein [Bradyrhizobium elkanii]|uniref:E2/UBC family protein n=1 Tax=Bradyrhizobium elkanii TaxID=29448 RepID=UPI001FEF55D8|nr:E2/UBC family protein [Bradyrhizobium elkanii]
MGSRLVCAGWRTPDAEDPTRYSEQKSVAAPNHDGPEAQQQLDGKTYQRRSRHRTGANTWKIGRDHIGTHVILIEDWLDREFEK